MGAWKCERYCWALLTFVILSYAHGERIADRRQHNRIVAHRLQVGHCVDAVGDDQVTLQNVIGLCDGDANARPE